VAEAPTGSVPWLAKAPPAQQWTRGNRCFEGSKLEASHSVRDTEKKNAKCVAYDQPKSKKVPVLISGISAMVLK
jgi:hypothetical protein